MNTKLVKKLLAATLAATLMVAPVITAGAASTTKEWEPHSDASSSTSSSSASTTSTVNAGGTVLTTGVNGSYSVKILAGVAVRQQASTIKANLGLAGTPYVRAYDITAAKSPAAFASINGAAASVGAVVLGAVNIDFGQMVGGKFQGLAQDATVPTTIGVRNANGRKLAVVKVLPGGATQILEDTDENPNTVTFPLGGGLAAYAIIAY